MATHKPYEPRKRRNVTLAISVLLFTVGMAALWVCRKKLLIPESDLIMYSGCVLAVILLTVNGNIKRNENYRRAVELRERQERIGTEDTSADGFISPEPTEYADD